MRITLLQLVGLVYLAGAAYQVDMAGGGHRFTWWNAVLFSLYALSDGTWLSGITVMTTLLVVTGVVVMSLRGCSLLQEAIDDMGSWGYILGTFAVHYVPFIATVGTTLIEGRTPIGPGALVGAGIFSLYTLVNDAGGAAPC